MKRNTKNILAGFGMATVAGVVLFSQSAFAYQGNPTSSRRGSNYTTERHTQIEKALETNDYTAWKKLMSETKNKRHVTEVITESNFAKFAEAHRLAEAGKITEANAIRKELGLHTSDQKPLGMERNKMKNGKGMNREILLQKTN